MSAPTEQATLTVEGCRQRQERLKARLSGLELDAALLDDPLHVYYLTGYWGPSSFAVAVLIPREGDVALATPFPAENEVAADDCEVYPSNQLCTIVDDLPTVCLQALLPKMKRLQRLGCDDVMRPWLLSDWQIESLTPTLLALRRTKDPDEVDLLRRSIAGSEAAYARARQIIEPGLTEVELFAQIQAAAVEAVGEPIGNFCSDFQAGTPGGPPRLREMRAGEFLPLDLSVPVRGYRSDLCRTFLVGDEPSAPQRQAHQLVVETLSRIENDLRPGASCKDLYHEVFELLDGQKGWRFFHHLGHGIGLSPHEAPRLNPHWDDTFQTGDVVAVEPGVYGDELRAGVRLEHNYLITDSGAERLSSYPLDL